MLLPKSAAKEWSRQRGAQPGKEFAIIDGNAVAPAFHFPQAATASAGVLKGLESKLAAIEGSVLSTGSTTREALRESAMAQGRLAQQSVARVEELATAVRPFSGVSFWCLAPVCVCVCV